MEQNHSKPFRLTEPRPPQLETSLRARPPKYAIYRHIDLLVICNFLFLLNHSIVIAGF